jgi:hypothetical protein
VLDRCVHVTIFSIVNNYCIFVVKCGYLCSRVGLFVFLFFLVKLCLFGEKTEENKVRREILS